MLPVLHFVLCPHHLKLTESLPFSKLGRHFLVIENIFMTSARYCRTLVDSVGHIL